ncbi:unnamed protein product, partial [Tilletia caries]
MRKRSKEPPDPSTAAYVRVRFALALLPILLKESKGGNWSLHVLLTCSNSCPCSSRASSKGLPSESSTATTPEAPKTETGLKNTGAGGTKTGARACKAALMSSLLLARSSPDRAV